MPKPDIHDDVLGVLRWDDLLHWYEGERTIAPGHKIAVSLSPEGELLAEDLTRARQAYQHIQKQEVALREMAADALLPLHNDVWNEGPPIDRAAFVRRMTLEGLSVYSDGSVELDYNDGDLFWGHTITVSLHADGTFEDATIQG